MEIRMRSEVGPSTFGDNDVIAVPYYVCEHCGKDIKEIGFGMFTYSWPENGGYATIQIWHKGMCDPRRRGLDGYDCWDELKYLAEYLQNQYSRDGDR